MSDTTEATGPKTAFKVVNISKDANLTVLVTENPKRPSSESFKRFEGYLTNPSPETVAEALENGVTMGDIKFDIIAGFITVDGAEKIEYEVKPRGTRVKSEEDTDEVEVEVASEDENF